LRRNVAQARAIRRYASKKVFAITVAHLPHARPELLGALLGGDDSLHGGGSPAAMKQEIYRNYPIGSKVELVERLLERGLTQVETPIRRNRQPGKCCDMGCTAPGKPLMIDLPRVESRRSMTNGFSPVPRADRRSASR
jgi:hypothetical protein